MITHLKQNGNEITNYNNYEFNMNYNINIIFHCNMLPYTRANEKIQITHTNTLIFSK